MKSLRWLFSFRGEMSRVAFWATVLILCLSATPIQLLWILVSALVGDPIYVDGRETSGPLTTAGIAVLIVVILLEIAVFWAIAAAMVRRLRDAGVAPRWLAVFAAAFALFIAALATFAGGGVANLSPFGIVALVATGVPAGVLGLWLVVSAFVVTRGSRLLPPFGRPKERP